MSNSLRYDPPLVHALAAELNAMLAGRSAHPQPVFAADLSATLPLDRGQSLRFDLHPARGWVRMVPTPPDADAPPAARIVRVTAPSDERLLRIDLHEGNRFRGGTRALVIELHTNQWNALLVDAADRRIVSLLRAREAGGRTLRAGEVYAPPSPRPRLSAAGLSVDDAWLQWLARLGALLPAERRADLLRSFAGTSPVNAAHVLGDAATAASEDALRAAFERWWSIEHPSKTNPVLLDTGSAPQPYPFPLDGLPARHVTSLLEAMEACAAAEQAEPEDRAHAALLARARKRVAAAQRRIERLEAERAALGRADELRARADLLLANLARVQSGAARVTVRDAEGAKLKIALDPALKPHENAERWYEEARRRARAEERLPGLLERARHEHARWEQAVAAMEAGEMPAWVEGALRRAETRAAPEKPAGAAERKPYRAYRTSGGLEVRVGRSSRDNDRLTFAHAAPDDVWLHAQHVPGSHVVLRWREPGAPPARDLEEAAVLAALHSRARSSGTVAVDWTRRKHLRKPRGAPPGRVVVHMAKTLFVAPDPAVEERLREGEGA